MGQEFKASGTIALVVQRFVKAKLLLNEASDSWVRRREVGKLGSWEVGKLGLGFRELGAMKSIWGIEFAWST